MAVNFNHNGRGEPVYALIDSGSNRTLVTHSLCKRLNVKTRKEFTHLTTLGVSHSCYRDIATINIHSLTDPTYKIKELEVFVVDDLPVDPSHIARQREVDAHPHLSDISLIDLDKQEVDVLIGTDVMTAFIPLEVKRSQNAPLAIKGSLGWGLLGQSSGQSAKSAFSAFVNLNSEPHLHDEVDNNLKAMFKNDFLDFHSESLGLSQEEQRALSVFESTCRFNKEDIRFQIGLPWKHDREKLVSSLPSASSEITARKRVNSKIKQLKSRPDLEQEIDGQVKKLLDEGVAEKVSENLPKSDPQIKWFLPPVIAEKRGKKPRFCQDCRAVTKGVSLNSLFLDCPDENNPLLATLLNLMLLPTVLLCDVKAFYHQVALLPEDKNAFCFFWKNPENESELDSLRMTRVVFGAKPSASAATFCFRKNAILHGHGFSNEVIEAINKGFYVDDGARSTENTQSAISLASGLIALCNKGGFPLTKFISNSRTVVESIPEELRHPEVAASADKLPSVPVLGLLYDAESDKFCVNSPVTQKAGEVATRSSVLSSVMSIFDPTGFLCPFVVIGKKLVQRLCYSGLDWKDELPPQYANEYNEWLKDVEALASISIPRWVGLQTKNHPVTLHIFADASIFSYGAVVYVIPEGTDKAHFLMAKARVSPEKETKVDVGGSTPRLELQACVVAVELVKYINEHLNLNVKRYVYWTDSTVCYYQIKSEDKKFKVYVNNRLNTIRLISRPIDWNHCPTDFNPGDVPSRGARVGCADRWRLFHEGPEFIRRPESEWPKQPSCPSDMFIALVVDESPKPVSFINDLLKRKSDFMSVKRIVAYVNRFIAKCKKDTVVNAGPPSAVDMVQAEMLIIKDVQRRHFESEISFLRSNGANSLVNKRYLSSKSSRVRELDPFIDSDGILRVGGRLKHSDEPFETKHPIILPHDDPFSQHLIWHTHISNAHFGLEFTLAQLRQRFWVLRLRQAVKKVLLRCFVCRRKWSQPMEQKMADLPRERLTVKYPFADTGVDLLGPYKVKCRRTEQKVWICLFTCLRVRAVHLDVVESLDTDAFLNSLQRFHSHYPGVTRLVSDQGTNFVGTSNLLESMQREHKVTDWLSTQLVKWDFIPPHSPHRGGIWERMVKTLKKTFDVLINGTLHLDQFRTVVTVAGGMLNRRPLTKNSCDPNDLTPLTPMTFLNPGSVIYSSNIVLPAAPLNGSELRRSKDTLRPILDGLWKRWRTEYVASLQQRSKWLYSKAPLARGDLVLLVDEAAPREFWPLAIVKETFPDSNGDVRRVLVNTASKKELEKDIRKVVLLERSRDDDSDIIRQRIRDPSVAGAPKQKLSTSDRVLRPRARQAP